MKPAGSSRLADSSRVIVGLIGAVVIMVDYLAYSSINLVLGSVCPATAAPPGPYCDWNGLNLIVSRFASSGVGTIGFTTPLGFFLVIIGLVGVSLILVALLY